MLRIALIGLVQAIGLAVYCWLVAMLMFSLSYYINLNNFLGTVFMLMLFVVSATISGIIVLGYPGHLVWRRRWGEAASIVGATVGWAIVILVAIIVAAAA